MIRIPKGVEEAIRAHGAKDYPRECVGALLGGLDGEIRIVEEARPLPNTFDPSWEADVRGGAAEDVQDRNGVTLLRPTRCFGCCGRSERLG